MPDFRIGIGFEIMCGRLKANSTILGMSSFNRVSPF